VYYNSDGVPVYEVGDYVDEFGYLQEDGSWSKIGFADEYDDNSDIPKGCQACGGPYPDCKTSCVLFDD
jgi:hypothetical protein